MPLEKEQQEQSKTNVVIRTCSANVVIRTCSGKEYYLYIDTQEANNLLNNFLNKHEIMQFKDNGFTVILRYTQVESVGYFKEEV